MESVLLTAIEAIYDAAPEPSRWPEALQAIADVFGDVAANLLWKRDDGSFGLIASPGLDPKAAAEYQEKWWDKDIRALRSSEQLYLNPDHGLTDRHVASPEEIATHPIYTDFLARQGLRWVAGTHISPDPRTFVSVNVQRSSAKLPFTDRELAILVRLGAHAEKSLRLSMRLLDAELAKLGLGEALARVGIAVFALDSMGRVVFSNPAADALSAGHIKTVNGRLHVGDNLARDPINTAVARTLHNSSDITADPKPIMLRRSPSEHPLVLYVLPVVKPLPASAQFLTHTRAIVLVIDAKADEPPEATLVRDVFGLTLGEARVAALVGSGLAPRQAATRLGIGEETARTTLKRVFSKLGVNRQSELSVLLSKLVLR